MLTKITLTNEEELFTCKVDEGLFQKRYPLIYKSYKKQTSSMELWDVEEVLPDNESIEAILIKEEAVLIQFDNGEKATIYNTEIIKFSGISFDGFSVFADSAFVYFIIIIAVGQGGSLGIWSLADKEWVFTHRDDDFCVSAITFLPESNCFVGFTEYYNYTNPGGELFFFINSNRGYTDMELNELEGFDWVSISPEAREEISLQQDATLVFDRTLSALYKIIDGEHRAYRLDEAQISALQHQATSLGW